MQKINTIRDGEWEYLKITEQQVEERKKKYFIKLEGQYPNLTKITSEDYLRLTSGYKAGDENVIDELIQKTLVYVLNPVVCAYSRYSIRSLEFEDAVNHSILVYITAISEFKFNFPETKSAFITQINRNIVHRLKREDQILRRHNIQLCVNSEHIDFELETDPKFDLIDEKLFKEDVVKVVYGVYNELTDKEKNIFIGLFKQRKKESVVANELGLSRETINQSKKKFRKLILRKLACRLNYIPKEYEFGGINPYED